MDGPIITLLNTWFYKFIDKILSKCIIVLTVVLESSGSFVGNKDEHQVKDTKKNDEDATQKSKVF